MLTKVLLLLAAVTATGQKDVSIRVTNPVVMSGGMVRFVCKVPQNAGNRLLRFGIVGSEREVSERQLDGEKAPITWGPFDVPRMPCGAGPAYCQVVKNDGSVVVAVQPIEVANCEP